MPIWVWYAKQPYGWTLANLTSIPRFRFSMSNELIDEEEQWMMDFRARITKREDSLIEDFIVMLDDSWEQKVKMTSEEFKTLPRGVQLAIIDLQARLEQMEYQIDEIRSICG